MITFLDVLADQHGSLFYKALWFNTIISLTRVAAVSTLREGGLRKH